MRGTERGHWGLEEDAAITSTARYLARRLFSDTGLVVLPPSDQSTGDWQIPGYPDLTLPHYEAHQLSMTVLQETKQGVV